MGNRVTVAEVLVPETPTIETTCSAEEQLTRTEGEYQELLEALRQLKMELRMEREANKRDARFRIPRGGKLEREFRRGSAGTVKSKETISTWLGRTPL